MAQLQAAMAPSQAGVVPPAGGAQVPATIAPGGTTGAPGGTTGAPAAVVAQDQSKLPEAMKSPPDLITLYAELARKDKFERSVNQNLGLIAAGLAHPENRANILSVTRDRGPSESGGVGMIGDIMKLRAAQDEQVQRASMMQNIPLIAQSYGLSVPTAQYLFQSGKLDEIIKELEKPDRQIVADPVTGVYKIVDKSTGEQIGADIGTPDIDRTNDQKDWARENADRVARGLAEISYTDWRMRENEKRGTNINIGDQKPTRFDEKSQEYFAEDYQNIRKSRNNARDMIAMYDTAEKALTDSNVRTGFFGGAEQALRKMYVSMGMGSAEDAAKVAGGELLTMIGNRLALLMRNPESGMGMPGAISDKDLAFLRESQIGIDRSPAGNRAMIEVARRLEKRKMDIADLADSYVQKNGKLDAGFDAVVKEYAEKNPLFKEGEALIQGGTEDQAAKDAALFKKYGIE